MSERVVVRRRIIVNEVVGPSDSFLPIILRSIFLSFKPVLFSSIVVFRGVEEAVPSVIYTKYAQIR